MSLHNRPKWSKQKPKTNLNKPSLPTEYEPRSPLVKAFPAIVIMSAVLVFVVVHFVAHHNTDLLGAQFLFGSPFFLGAWIAYFSSYHRPVTLGKVSVEVFWVIIIIMLISIPILKEGIICMMMAFPILYGAMWFGAMLMHVFCTKIWKSKALHSIALLPILVLFAPLEEESQHYQTTKSIIIEATPAEVWQAINHIEEVDASTFYQSSRLLPFMGVPTPKSAITVNESGQLVRKCQWYGDIYFDEPIVASIDNKHLRWQFKFYEDSVPAGTLDDHVTINGEHFQLLYGQYDIEAISPLKTRLTFQVDYEITTNINAYAGFWGQWVMDEFSTDVLAFYQRKLS